jgi:hypothetical protein
MIYLQSYLQLAPSEVAGVNAVSFRDSGKSAQQADCWRLSNLRLRNLPQSEVVFYGSDRDLIDGVSYGAVHEFPKEIKELPPRCWSVGKLYAASMQTEPFLHVDMDCFLGLPVTLTGFTVQSEEHYFEPRAWGWFYGLMACLIKKGIKHPLLEEVWEAAHASRGPVLWNFGVFGGGSWIVPQACGEVVEFCLEHKSVWQDIPPYIFVTCALEQIFVPLLCLSRGVSPKPLLRRGFEEADSAQLAYCHLIADSKHDPKNIEAVKVRLAELTLTDN